MLNIFYSREDADHDKFIYDHIEGRTLVLVPDQFTLQAERDAIRHLGTKGLLDTEVLSLNRLETRILGECGGRTRRMISREGRHMLLAGIISRAEGDLGVFGGTRGGADIIEMTNDLISELKQYGVAPSDLSEAAMAMPENVILRRKLDDIRSIYEEYENSIKGRYIDTEDRISLAAAGIPLSDTVASSSVWIYGFDYFTPKNLELISALIRTARSVNIVLTFSSGRDDDEIFSIGGMMINKLKQCAEDAGCASSDAVIIDSAEYPVKRSLRLAFTEKNLFAVPRKKMVKGSAGDSGADDEIVLVRAANIDAEMETAALTVRELIAERGYRYSDIAILCNDQEVRGRAAVREFSQYGMDLYLDEKRDIMSNPAVSYVNALLKVISSGYRREDVIMMMKSGLTDLSEEEIGMLEKYAEKYRVRGAAWRSSFVKGADEFDLEAVERSRSGLIGPIEDFDREFTSLKKASDRVKAIYDFLAGTARVPDKLREMIDEQSARGRLDIAEETAQVWNVMVRILDQINEIVGPGTVSKKDFAELFLSGTASSEIGILPPSRDVLMMGTMQRTRTTGKKAVLVLGANEDILPKASSGEGLISEDEKQELADRGIEIGRLDSLKAREEEIAIYRNMSKATEFLYVSCSDSDEEGSAARPSAVFDSMRNMFPDIRVREDAENEVLAGRSDPMRLVQAPGGTLTHLADAIREAAERGGELGDVWNETRLWYKENMPEKAETLEAGLTYRNRVSRIDRKLAEKLYMKAGRSAFTVSPSRLEKFGKCPFMHFVKYGLAPDEPRVYEIGGAEIGDICHDTLMKLAARLTVPGVEITGEGSPWLSATDDELSDIIDSIIDESSVSYKEGLFRVTRGDEYRTARLRNVIKETALNMVGHVRRGQIEDMRFEAGFGYGGELGAIDVPESNVMLTGKIDRLDILPGNFAKVIDYKSGNVKFNSNAVKNGIQLQLMMYMLAAASSGCSPAGAFYFLIGSDPMNAAEILKYGSPKDPAFAEEREKNIMKHYRMDGIVMNEPEVASSIETETDDTPAVLSAGLADGRFKTTKRIESRYLSREDFNNYLSDVEEIINEMCRDLEDGNIEIKPKSSGKNGLSCMYCDYSGICGFDRTVPGYRIKYI